MYATMHRTNQSLRLRLFEGKTAALLIECLANINSETSKDTYTILPTENYLSTEGRDEFAMCEVLIMSNEGRTQESNFVFLQSIADYINNNQ